VRRRRSGAAIVDSLAFNLRAPPAVAGATIAALQRFLSFGLRLKDTPPALRVVVDSTLPASPAAPAG
jgi:hypothetical protein